MRAQMRGVPVRRHLRSRRTRAHLRGGAPRALFTGIVQGTARVARFERREESATLTIAFPEGSLAGIEIGASVAVNGTCLTVTEASGDEASFDLIVETLRATNLGLLEVGSDVNYERSARLGDEIGGHTVSGHVHCKAEMAKVEDTAENRRITFRVPDASWMPYILPKGFIGVDGCSLTVGEVEDDTFTVYLIPETIRKTVFRDKGEGDSVNIEVEHQTMVIVETIERVLAQREKQESVA
mmetsp:Transcript_7686/g.25470  ORF Transcript_7686/g.25470 Transcript_7686/m.25470 type:complete len:240 (-) Transcript_7686:1021-1740(-)